MADDSRPIPDPTTLTTAQLHRELIWLREVLESRMDGSDRAVDIAFKAAEAAVLATKEAAAKTEAATAAQIAQISEAIRMMNDRLIAGDGRAKGLSDGWGYLFGVIGLGVAVAAVVVRT